MRIYHLTHHDDWATALETGRYEVSTRGATLEEVGFIHCSTREQLAKVAQFQYGGATEALVVLELDDDTVRSTGTAVRYEDGGNGEMYPHIYGPVDPAWVTAVHPASVDDQGRFRW